MLALRALYHSMPIMTIFRNRYPLWLAGKCAASLVFLTATLGACPACERVDSSSEGGSADAREPVNPAFSTWRMDPSVKPGEDFFRYANGTWLRQTVIPPDKSRWGGFQELEESNWRRIREVLEETASHPAATGSIQQKIGDFYRSAMDETRLEALGMIPMQTYWAEIATVKTAPDVARQAARQHRTGLGRSAIFGSYVYPDRKNSAFDTFYMVQGGLGMPDRDYYLEEKFAVQRAAYAAHLQALFVLTGMTSGEAVQAAQAVLDIETTLAAASRPRPQLRQVEKNYHKMTLAETQALAPGLPWIDYLDELGLAGRSTVILGQPEFFTAVGKLLAEKPVEDWRAYLRAHLLTDAAPYLSEPFVQEHFHFNGRVLNGAKAIEPRWQRIARQIDGTMGEALGQLYVERYFPPSSKARVREMVDHIRAVFRSRLETLAWMSAETRVRGLAKFDRFRAKIGYPDRWIDYGRLTIEAGDYFGNIVRGNLFNFQRQMAKVDQPVNREEWRMSPPTVNAYFSSAGNEIVFPAGILQPPFFDPAADDAVNYGMIGAVIGHEITHGYDDQGRKFDAEGNLEDWWTPEDAARFKDRTCLLIEQYNGYEVLPGSRVNGELSLGENIADLGGVSIAFDAFQRSLQGRARPVAVDGLECEQRFFLSWAQGWRSMQRPEALQRMLTVGPHSPGQIRAFAPLLHLEPFYKAFQIGASDPLFLDPSKRAFIW